MAPLTIHTHRGYIVLVIPRTHYPHRRNAKFPRGTVLAFIILAILALSWILA